MNIIFWSIFILMSGSSLGTKATESPLEQIVGKLESSGKYPVLDRTDTLAGIDADKNGIRDDIDLFISKQNYMPKQKKAVTQTVMVLQRMVTTNLDNKTALKKLQEDNKRYLACMWDFKDSGKIGDIHGLQVAIDYRILITNTKKRYRAYKAFNHTLDGTTLSRDDYKDNPCDK